MTFEMSSLVKTTLVKSALIKLTLIKLTLVICAQYHKAPGVNITYGRKAIKRQVCYKIEKSSIWYNLNTLNRKKNFDCRHLQLKKGCLEKMQIDQRFYIKVFFLKISNMQP